MVELAQQNGIVEMAQSNAEDSIRTLVTSLAYEKVEFA
jgi:hypothetical protein